MWSAGRTLAFMPLADQHLDLQEAADRLGVHYQTAYRWVRTGRLPASLIGGRYTIDVADLDALESVRHTPRRRAAPSARRLQRSAERVRIDLLAGDEIAVRALARRLVDEGSSVVEVIQSLFVPAMYEIGQAWQAGQIAIWQEHRAAAIVERVIGDLAPNPRGRRRGLAVVAAVAGDRHWLPTTMAAMALRDDNWIVEHLGADLPEDEILHFCTDHDVRLVALTVTTPEVADRTHRLAEQLRTAGTRTIVGRPGLTLDDLIHQARATSASRHG